MDTPKHLIAMAASKNTAARGNVRFATAKKDERRCGVCRAQAERRYRPNAATVPEKAQVNMPGMMPEDARAYNNYTDRVDFQHDALRQTGRTYPRKGEHA
jgi:hypothetical protein